MNRHGKEIYDKIVNLGENLDAEITSITQNNPQLIKFLESSDGSHQNLLIDSKWGSGKTYTLKLLSFGVFSKIKEQLVKLTDFPIIKENFEELNNCNSINILIEKYNELQINEQNNSLNLNELLIQFDKYIFINLDEILYSNNWIEELYFAISQELWNHKVVGDDSTFKSWVKVVFNLDEKDIEEWKQDSIPTVKKLLPKTIQSWIRLLPLRKKYRDKINGNYQKNINDIYELINNEESTIFVFENLERVTDVKIMEFFGQFNSIFSGIYENKKHKFIFNVDEEVLKEKLNDNQQHREKYLNKYFDQKLTLVTSDSIKIKLVSNIINDSFNEYASDKKKELFENENWVHSVEDIYDFSIESILYVFKINLSYEFTSDINQEVIKQIKNKSIREIEKINYQELNLNWNNYANQWHPTWKNMNFILKLGLILYTNEMIKWDIISYPVVDSNYSDLLNPKNKIPRFLDIRNALKIIPEEILEKHVKMDEYISKNNLISYEIINEI